MTHRNQCTKLEQPNMVWWRKTLSVTRLSWLGLLSCTLLTLAFSATPASAQPASDEATREQARQHFDRGLRLFNEGDNSGALVEFQQAYQAVQHPLVLYNIGLVYEATKRPVEAVDTLDKLLQNPGSLAADRVSHARRVRDEQAGRIGELDVRANVPGAKVEVDGVGVAELPLKQPLRLASGEHIVGVYATGYLPERRPVSVFGKSKAALDLQLSPLEGQPAQITVRANVLDAEVWIDDKLVGLAPLPASIPVAAGDHRVEGRRTGYKTASRQLALGEGSTGEVDLELSEDAALLSSSGGTLVLEISESDPVVFLDGRSRGVYAAPLRLPPGRHALRIERGEFLPVERDVTILANQTTTVTVALEPTAEKRAAYTASARSQRLWAWVATGAGSVLSVGSATFLVINTQREDDKRKAIDEISERAACDGTSPDYDPACTEELSSEIDNLDSILAQRTYGWVGVGVGAAALITGVTLFVTADDPDRYEPKPESDVFAGVELTPSAWVGKETWGLGAVGRF